MSQSEGPPAEKGNVSITPLRNEIAEEESRVSLVLFSGLKRWQQKCTRFFKRRNSSLEEEVAELIEEHDPEGIQVSSEERTMLHNILQLNELKVNDVMIPRADMVAVEEETTLQDLRKIILETEHTRMPVYKGTLDHISGFIHIKDLIPYLDEKKPFFIKEILRKVLFVPPSMKLMDLLVKMRGKRVHMAVVLDEYSGTDGLVTLEDVVEEIVGEIEDEHDEKEAPGIIARDTKTWEVNARLPVGILEKKLHIRLNEDRSSEEYDTVGGLIFYLIGRVPSCGEKIAHPAGIEFEILDANPRRINKLLARKHTVMPVPK